MLSNPDAVRSEILKIVAQPGYKPQKPKKFLATLGLTSDDSRPLRLLIREMIAKGEIAYGVGHVVMPIAKDRQQTAAEVLPHRMRRLNCRLKNSSSDVFNADPPGLASFVRGPFPMMMRPETTFSCPPFGRKMPPPAILSPSL